MASEQEIIELIEQIGIVPVVVLEDEKDAEANKVEEVTLDLDDAIEIEE